VRSESPLCAEKSDHSGIVAAATAAAATARRARSRGSATTSTQTSPAITKTAK